MDNLLLPLLNARNEQERQQRLDELLRIHVAPIIKQVLRQRLGFYVSAQGVNENNHDAEDLYQEAMTRMVQVLHTTQRSLTTIDNFERYAGRVVSNICVDFLRSKYPARARLKEGLRDVFRRHRDLASWQYKNEILCGFAVWRNTGKRVVAAYDVDTKLDAFLSARLRSWRGARGCCGSSATLRSVTPTPSAPAQRPARARAARCGPAPASSCPSMPPMWSHWAIYRAYRS
jgi:DNA-directed RNA polymerase specialized sigma24 family protein